MAQRRKGFPDLRFFLLYEQVDEFFRVS